MKITSSQVTEANGTMSTFASDIGIRPGDTWPDIIQVDYPNGAVYFHKQEPITYQGEFAGYRYETVIGKRAVLAVFND